MSDQPLDPRLLAQLVDRVSRPDYPAFAAQLDAIGGCANPVRLTGHATHVDTTTGEITGTYTSTSQPDRTHLNRCRTRRASICPACAALYAGDARHLITAGVTGHHATAPVVFATLTAPSYGPVHRTGGPCHPHPVAGCAHLTSRCDRHHPADDPTVGTPLCADCYDHTGVVLFNNQVTRLWHHTATAIRRHLAATLGLPVRAVPWRQIAHIKIVEYQRRGAIHLHALIRLDRPGINPRTGEIALVAAVTAAAAATTITNPLGDRPPIGWGDQAAVVPIGLDDRERTAGYLTKYVTKSVTASGALDHRPRSRPGPRPGLPEHLQHLATTAWDLADRPELAACNLRPWAHTLGYRGHWLTKTRTWSTTFGHLREQRHQWQLAQHGHDPDHTTTVGEWAFVGTGHTSDADRRLARNNAATRQTQRRTAWEER